MPRRSGGTHEAQATSPATPRGNKDMSRNGGRQELNHLLSFHLPPRQRPAPAPRRSTRAARQGSSAHAKEKYINAQFRFILKPTGGNSYGAHFADPDIPFQWADILQIIVPTSSALASVSSRPIELQEDHGMPSCPICLCPPIAARMTRCGHIFCFGCILHYLELSEGPKWRRCPVCWDLIHGKDLKSVKWFDAARAEASDAAATQMSNLSLDEAAPNEHPAESVAPKGEGELLRMRLVYRPQITTLALPRSPTWPSDAVPPHEPPWQFTPDAFGFAKFMIASPDYIREELQRELDALETELRTGGLTGADEISQTFSHAALRKVREQLAEIDLYATTSVMTARKSALKGLQAVADKPLPVTLPIGDSSDTADDSAPSEYLAAQGLVATPAAAKPRKNLNPPPQSEATFLYYQAASGQHIYLHPLDIRILKSHFGTYENFPDSISIRVDGSDEGSMNEALGRRCRYLAHLSPGTDVVFVEADLSSVVSADTLRSFAGALKQRRSKRRDRARKEDRALQRNEEREQHELMQQLSQRYGTSYSSPIAIPGSAPNAHDELDFPAPAGAERASPSDAAASVSPASKSFATAAYSSAWSGAARGQRAPEPRDEEVDATWHDFEQQMLDDNAAGGAGSRTGGGGGGRRGRKKLVLNLSGGARGR